MGWTLVYMVLILKIPLVAALVLIWYAVKEEPLPEEGTTDEERHPKRRPPQRPRWPRRGPKGGAGCHAAPCPELTGNRLKAHRRTRAIAE